MIKYDHFALANLFLSNGYELTRYGDEDVIFIQEEEKLESCLCKLLVLTPGRLTGRRLRFIRRALHITQPQLGEHIGRDGQTVARLEKSDDVLARPFDLAIRLKYLNASSIELSTAALTKLVDGVPPGPHVRNVFRWHPTAGWAYSIETNSVSFRDSKNLSVDLAQQVLYAEYRHATVAAVSNSVITALRTRAANLASDRTRNNLETMTCTTDQNWVSDDIPISPPVMTEEVIFVTSSRLAH